MNVNASQFSTDLDALTIRKTIDLERAENRMLQDILKAQDLGQPSTEDPEMHEMVEYLTTEIRTHIGKVVAGRLERGDRKKTLLDLGDTTTIVLGVIGRIDDDQARNMLLALVKPLVETMIKAFVSDLKHDPYEGDLYDKAFARIRIYLVVARTHPELTDAELIASPAIRAEYYGLVETPQSWDGKIARAQRTLRRLNVSNVFDDSLAPHLEGTLAPLDERQATLNDITRDAAKHVKLIYDIRKAEIWPKDK